MNIYKVGFPSEKTKYVLADNMSRVIYEYPESNSIEVLLPDIDFAGIESIKFLNGDTVNCE